MHSEPHRKESIVSEHFKPRAAILATLFLSMPVWAAEPLPRSTPEEQGVSSSAVLDFVTAANERIDTMNSFMLVRHGHVVAEGWWAPYNASSNHELYSLSKSFTSTAVGLAIAEGKFTLDDPVLKFFPDIAPTEPSANLKAMRVRDLLSMNTGQHSEDLEKVPLFGSDAPSKEFLNLPVAHKPGTHFLYNTPATYMLSAIVQKNTGSTVLDYLGPRLFQPLGIDNPVWGTTKEGVTFGGFGLSIRTEDIARFGQLYLQKGQWQGKQLVPADWVAAATSRQTSTGSSPTSDWEQGYGYQFWRSRHGYRGDGAFGQFCFVLPELDAVVAITSGGKDMQAVMNLVWDKLLPAMQPAALPADAANQKKLKQTLSTLTVKTQQGKATPKVPGSFSGRTYTFPANDGKLQTFSLDWQKNRNQPVMRIKVDGTDYTVPCSRNEWVTSTYRFSIYPKAPVATTCNWIAPDTFGMKLVFFETPHIINATAKFAGDQVTLDSEMNVGFGETKQPTLIGRVQ